MHSKNIIIGLFLLQEAINNGIIATKVPDYLLAVRYFEEARKVAPQSPEIFFNLGLAESKIPGRELRAICWFGAYLTAAPDAPNTAAVKEQMKILFIKYSIFSNVPVSYQLMMVIFFKDVSPFPRSQNNIGLSPKSIG